MGEERERITTEVAEDRRGNGETGMGFECVAIEGEELRGEDYGCGLEEVGGVLVEEEIFRGVCQ